jgi:parallel beta-helix repeat protein
MLLALSLCAAHRARAATIYVLASGDDGADGSSPATAFRTIGHAAVVAKPGDRVVVGRGKYTEGDINPAAFGRVSFVADRRGTQTGAGPGDVVIDASGHGSGFVLDHNLAVTVDGFVIYGGEIGIYVKSQSDQAVISNNIVSSGEGEGIYVQDSQNVMVFNNLTYNNGRHGILVTGNVSGSPGAKIINNTAYGNVQRGIFFAGTTINSPGGLALNNIAQANGVAGVEVNTGSRVDYVSAGNVWADRIASGTPIDVTDVQADPEFVNPPGRDGILGGVGYADDDFHLSDRTAGQAVTSPAVNAGSDFASALRLRSATTRIDGRADVGVVDAGYHYRNFRAPPPQPQTHVRAVPLYVDANRGSDTNDGATAATALQSLSRSFELAQPGNRVVMLPGTYRPDSATGDLRLTKSGKPGREVVIQGTPGAVIDATGLERGVLVVGAANVTLAGLDIKGANGSGIEIRNGFGRPLNRPTGNISVSDCHLHQNARRGLYVNGASNVTVQGALIEDNGATGVQVEGGDVDIAASTIRANAQYGLWALHGSVVSVSNSQVLENAQNGIMVDQSAMTVTDTTLSSNGEDGFQQTGGSASISSLTVTANGGNGITVSNAGQVVVQNVRVGMSGQTGVLIDTASSASVRDSVVYSSMGNGVIILDVPAPEVFNNLIYANTSSGVLISANNSGTGSPNAQVLNNTFYANGTRGLMLGGGNAKPPSQGAVVMRNIFQGNGKAGLQVSELSLPGYIGDYNLTADPYGPFTPIGLHDIIADPLLVNPAGADGILGGAGAADDDFHLSQIAAGQRSTSPAVDAGGIDVVNAGLSGTTTRTDGVPDSGPVDLGYHYP